jgi:uncharacterized protein with beta-barrel porin domain
MGRRRSAYAGDQPTGPAANALSAFAGAPNPTFVPNLSFWTAAYGGSGTTAGNSVTGAASTNSQIYGAATGLDYRINPDMLVGFALGGGGTSWQLGQGLGNGHSGMFQAGVYATGHSGPAYLSPAAAYSLQDVTTNRNATPASFDGLQGQFDASFFSSRVESGYRLSYGGINVTPYGAVQFQALVMPSYSEFARASTASFPRPHRSSPARAPRATSRLPVCSRSQR